MDRRLPFAPALIAGAVLVLAGCANLPRPDAEASAKPAPAPAAASVQPAAPAVGRFADDRSNRYVRLDAANTGLLAVADDGANTFAAFAEDAKNIEVFNQDGKPLRAAYFKNIVAVEGRHQGVLFTSPKGNSFAAPNPRAPAAVLESLNSDPDVAEVRLVLEGRTTQAAAYQRAVALASGKGLPAAPSAAPAPKAMAEDETFVRQDDGVLMRVFFASGGRSIVRPDDGLARLTKEAMNARLIRVAGYTDNQGSPSWNSQLAQQRAEAIRNHLIKAGIPADRILVAWPGPTNFLAENGSEKGRALNRRVEVMMLQ